MSRTLRDIYKYYKAEGGKLSKHEFKNICCDFNIHMMDSIIYDAQRLDMGSYMGTIDVCRIERKFKKNRRVDWKASNEYKQELLDEGKKLYDSKTGEGTKWLIFQTTDNYCRFSWRKKQCVVVNKQSYAFIPTRGNKGNKEKLKEHLRESDINYLKYRNASLQ